VPCVEVRCLLPCPEATGVTIQVSSSCYWCPLVRNRQICEDLGVPLFADHIRALTASFDLKLADVGKPWYSNLADTYADWELTPSPNTKAKGGRGQQASRGHRLWWPSRLNKSRSALISRAHFGYPDWGFPWFSSVVRQMPGYRMQSWGTAHTPLPQARWLHLSTWKSCKPAVCNWASLGSEPRRPTKQSLSLP